MSKKETQNVYGRICEMMEQEDKEVVSTIEKFYPYGTLASFCYSSMSSPLTLLLTQAKAKAADPHASDQKLLADVCQKIRNCVQQGKPESVEIQLNKAQQVSDKCIYPLGNTAIKILPSEGEPFYLFMKAGDTLDASIFLGGDYGGGVMLIRDENGDDFFLGLSEVHMLSLKEDSDPRKEVGLMTSYVWLNGKVCTSTILGINLNPIKNLLLADFLQTQWQHIKDTISEPTNEGTGGENGEQ